MGGLGSPAGFGLTMVQKSVRVLRDEQPAIPVGTMTPASWCMLAVVILTLVQVFTESGAVGLFAIPFLLAYLMFEWSRLMINARILLVMSFAIALYVAAQPNGMNILTASAARMIYLPAFVALLGLLRAAANVSPVVARAGRHLINQKPQLRYVALSFGGHIFGILFNIGGLALLVDMTKRANTLEAAGGRCLGRGVARAADDRGDHAVFCDHRVLVTHRGVALNLLLATIPNISWSEVVPYGLVGAFLFIVIGWLFDQVQKPPVANRSVHRTIEHGGGLAVAAVAGHVLVLSGLTGIMEIIGHMSFQTTLLIVVPFYAFLWAMVIAIRAGVARPVRQAADVMWQGGVMRFPFFANEMAVFSTSGFLGVALIALIPPDDLQGLFAQLALPGGVIAAGLMLLVAGLGFIGLNPLITAAILGGVMSSTAIPGFTPLMLVMALQIGWAITVVCGPLNSSLVMTANILGRPTSEIGPRWNGAFSLTILALASAYFVVLA